MGCRFGQSISRFTDIDGDGAFFDVFVGAPHCGGSGVVFTVNAATGTLFGALNGSSLNASDGDIFGTSISGPIAIQDVQVLVVGAPGDDTGAEGAGAVHVLEILDDGRVKNESAWKITDGFSYGAALGSSISPFVPAEDGRQLLLVAAPFGEEGGTTGYIVVFAFSSFDEVEMLGRISNVQNLAFFGMAFSAFGGADPEDSTKRIVLVGSPDPGFAKHRIEAVSIDGSGGSVEYSTMDALEEFADAETGVGERRGNWLGAGVSSIVSVSTATSTYGALVCAPFDDDGATDSGSCAFIVMAKGLPLGQRSVKPRSMHDVETPTVEGQQLGWSVSELADLNGDGFKLEALVGAPGADSLRRVRVSCPHATRVLADKTCEACPFWATNFERDATSCIPLQGIVALLSLLALVIFIVDAVVARRPASWILKAGLVIVPSLGDLVSDVLFAADTSSHATQEITIATLVFLATPLLGYFLWVVKRGCRPIQTEHPTSPFHFLHFSAFHEATPATLLIHSGAALAIALITPIWHVLGAFLFITRLLLSDSIRNFWLLGFDADTSLETVDTTGNTMLMTEIFAESFPQICIVASNNSITGSWSAISIASLTFSGYMLLRHIWKYFFALCVKRENVLSLSLGLSLEPNQPQKPGVARPPPQNTPRPLSHQEDTHHDHVQKHQSLDDKNEIA